MELKSRLTSLIKIVTQPERPWATGVAILWAILFVHTSFKALRLPCDFAKGHWLFNYHFGFLKRALPGTLVEPWLRGKSSAEINAILEWWAAVLWLISSYVIVNWAYRVLKNPHGVKTTAILLFSTTIFMVSPFVQSQADLVGYFDHLLVISTVLSISLVRKKHFALAGIVGLLSILSHESYTFFGLPAVCLSVLCGFEIATPEPRAQAVQRILSFLKSMRSLVLPYLRLLLLPIVAVVVIAWFEKSHAFSGPGRDLFDYISEARVMDDVQLYSAFHPFWVTVAQNHSQEWTRFLELAQQNYPRQIIYPVTLSFLASAVLLLWVRRRGSRFFYLEILATVAVVISPMAIAAIGWDRVRFMYQTHFHGLAAILIIADSPKIAVTPPIPFSTKKTVGLILAFALSQAIGIKSVIDGNIRNIVLSTRAIIGEEALFRRKETRLYYCKRALFPNSDFSQKTLQNWQSRGHAFDGQPLLSDVAAWRGAPTDSRTPWVGTFEDGRNQQEDIPLRSRIQGDGVKGALRSIPFKIEGDVIIFQIGGGGTDDVFVRLSIDGKTVHRASGLNTERLHAVHWNVSAYKGETAILEIVDNSSDGWGHINAAGFCYFR